MILLQCVSIDMGCNIYDKMQCLYPIYDMDNPGISRNRTLKQIKCNCVLQRKEY